MFPKFRSAFSKALKLTPKNTLRGVMTIISKFMNRIFLDLISECMFVYIDDIIIFSKNIEDHIKHLKLVFEISYKHELKVYLKNVPFSKRKLSY